jgi:Alginate lyase
MGAAQQQINPLFLNCVKARWIWVCALWVVAYAHEVRAQPTGIASFKHPGLLHTQEALTRVKRQVQDSAEPWASGWKKLVANSHSSSAYKERPVDTVYRGTGTPENYSLLYNDIAAAYANALRWHISGQEAHAQAAIRILDAWSAQLKNISGTSDRFLAAGIYGYQFANAVELMRDYAAWEGLEKSKAVLKDLFYPLSHDFLLNHNGSCISHYWANWDLVNIAAVLAIGIVLDDSILFQEAVTYFKIGSGNGSIGHVVTFLHPDGLGQWQESGRDQGHSLLGPAIAGAICEMAWSQGEDLYGYDDNRLLRGFEYVAKYNLGDSVPFAPYNNCDNVNHVAISEVGRGGLRPGWELILHHYAGRKGLAVPNIQRYAEKVRPEGGGGDYGPNSGGFDQLGYGTLMSSLPTSSTHFVPSARMKARSRSLRPARHDLRGRREKQRRSSLSPLTFKFENGSLAP